MKKNYFLISVLFVGLWTTQAQQLPQFSQYMYNAIYINPAFAGSSDAFSLTLLNRNQWAGIRGAPLTQTLSIHTPLRNEQIGLGFSVINDKTGYEHYTYLYADFSYTINVVPDITLSFGIKGGFSFYDLDKNLFTEPSVLQDPFFMAQFYKWTPNYGAGLFLSSQRWYVGLSAPKMINNNNNEFSEYVALEQVHYFLTGGYVFDLNDTWKLRPTALVKATNGAPLSFDMSGTVIYDEKLYLGASYRIDEAIGAFIDFQVFKSLRIGYAYEYSVSDLNRYTTGSHEIILIYEVKLQNTTYKSPRFF